jgi:hypothetical protein
MTSNVRKWRLRCAGSIAALLVATTLLAAEGRGRPAKIGQYDPNAQTVEMFAAIEKGDIAVKLIPKDSKESRILIENKTDKPLNVKLPDAFAGVPVLAQGGLAAPNNNRGSRNSGSSGRNGGNQNQGMGGGMGGMGMMGGGMFSVPPPPGPPPRFCAKTGTPAKASGSFTFSGLSVLFSISTFASFEPFGINFTAMSPFSMAANISTVWASGS